MAEWLLGGADPCSLPTVLEGFEALFIKLDGSAWEIDDQMRTLPACVPWAGGSGCVIAMSAMVLGLSAREAVALAIKLDCHTGGEIVEVKVPYRAGEAK